MDIHALLSHPAIRAHIEKALAARGVGGDNHIVHVNSQEEAMLKAMGGSGTVNPRTGLRQFNQVGPGGASGGQGGLGGANGDALGGDDHGGPPGGHDGGGSGAGAGGGHTGNNHTVDNPQQPVVQQPTMPAVQQPVTLPAAPPPNIATTPMMSQTASANLIGNRFGAMPGWATQPYQIGTAPTSYPVGGQPFDTTGQPPVAPPPVMPPPVAPGGGGGQPGGGGGGFGGGGGQLGQPGQPGQGIPPEVANFMNVLRQHGIGLGLNPLSHQTPGFADIISGGGYKPPDLSGQGGGSIFQKAFGGQPQPKPQQGTQNQQQARVTSSGASPAHPMQPTRAGGVLTGIMGSKPPSSQARTLTGAGSPRNR